MFLFCWNEISEVIMGLLSHTWIGCLLALLPGPPRIRFYNANFRLYPVDKTNKYCPEVKPGRDIGFYLYSREFPVEPLELRIGDDVTLSSSGLNLQLPTVIYFPPFFDGFDSRNVREVKDAYLQAGNYNFVAVNSERLTSGPWYPAAVSNTLIIGKYAAAFIDYLLLKGLSLKGLHLVGLSIGAHAAGVAGHYMRFGKAPRITGLDPASLLFVGKKANGRLDKTDAELVDVIHTDGIFGTPFPMGHVDFFVDSGIYPQPGCKIREVFGRQKGILFTVFCSHLRSNQLYARSVLQPTVYRGYKCSSWIDSHPFDCSPHNVAFMGANVTTTARGIYWVSTNNLRTDERSKHNHVTDNPEKLVKFERTVRLGELRTPEILYLEGPSSITIQGAWFPIEMLPGGKR